MTKSIPWNTGSGNITLTYTGQGDGVVTVTSDANNLAFTRRQTISFYVTDGAIRENLTASGVTLRTSDGEILTVLDAAMKVSVEVIQPTGMKVLLASSVILRDSRGRKLRVLSA